MRQAMMFSKRGTSSAEVTAAIAASIGGDQFPWVETFNAATAPGWSIATVTANGVYLTRVRVPKAITVSKVRVRITTASGNGDFGIYTSADNGSTFTRVAQTGPTAIASSGVVEIALTASYTLQPGVDYWIAGGVDNATVTIGRLTAVDGTVSGDQAMQVWKSAAWSSGLPASLSSMTGGGVMLWVRLLP